MTPVEAQKRQQDVEQQALLVVAKARTFVTAGEYEKAVKDGKAAGLVVITTNDLYLEAAEFGKAVAGKINEVEAFFEDMRKPAWDAYQAVMTKKKKIIDPLTEAKKQMSTVIGAFEAEQERIRQEQQRALEAQQQKEADDEKIELAAHLESQGRADEAQQVLEQEAAPVAVVVPREIPKAQGVSGRTNYSAECFNLIELLKAVIENKVPASAVQVNQSYIDSRARSDKELFAIPGCKLIKKTATTFRPGR